MTTSPTLESKGALDAFRELCRRHGRVRRLRSVSLAAVVLLSFAAVLGGVKPRVVTLFDRASVGALHGCLSFGVHRDLPPSWNTPVSRPIASLGGFGRGVVGVFEHPVNADAGAWRPYHAAAYAAHHLIIPIWQPLVLAVLGLGWSHGFLRGMRWRDPRVCLLCGHRLLPTAGGSSCAERGLLQTTATMPREGLAMPAK
jgi:hypothetical protein